MTNELIYQAATLMSEQADAYRQLDSTAKQLAAALVRGAPEVIESLVRGGESELLRMRSRLVRIIAALTAFADARAAAANSSAEQPTATAVDPAARQAFEQSSSELVRAARDFQRTHQLASSLSLGGSSFAAAFIQACGVPPTTYRGPYARRAGESASWA